MALNPSHIGTIFPPVHHEVERGQIRALAAAIGDPNPIYRDVAVAQAAGYPDLAAPPTLPTCFSLWQNDALLAQLDALGASLVQMLHGEQEYEYHAPVSPGDHLTGVTTVADIRHKQGKRGAIDLVTLKTRYTNQRDELVVVERLVVVVKE